MPTYVGTLMELLRVKLLTGEERPPGGKQKIHITVHRAYAYLADLLGKAFEGQQNVEVVVDPKIGGGRSRERPAPADQRQATAAEPRRASSRKGTRRRPKDEQSGKPV